MFDRSVSLGCSVAYLLWTGAVVAMVFGTVLGSLEWQSWALMAALGGGTATIRQYHCRTNRLMREAVETFNGGDVGPSPIVLRRP